MKKSIDDKVKEENVKLHNFSARNFDNYPPYLKKRVNKIFYNDSKFIRELFKKKPLALDCGCGTGELTANLFKCGFDIEAIDISKEMISLTKKKIKKLKCKNKIIFAASEIDQYLKNSNKKYDLICFTAVLHHIVDYMGTLKLAMKKLSENGVIYIADEPQKQMPSKNKKIHLKIISFIENNSINLYRIVTNPKHAFRFIKNKVFGNNDQKINVSLAEFHARKGLDDQNIKRLLKDSGMNILKFGTYIVHPFSIFEITNFLYKKEPKTFKIIAKKGKA